MPKPPNSKFNPSINGPQYQSSIDSKWNDSPLEIGMEVEILSGQFSGQTAVITKIDRPKKNREAPKITISIPSGTQVDAASQQWRRKHATAPIWSGPQVHEEQPQLIE